MAKRSVRLKPGGLDIEAALKRAIAYLGDPANMKRYGQMAADMIRTRTRLGYGVEKDGAERSRLKPLSDKTIEARKGNIAFFTSPSTGKPIGFEPDERPKLHEHTTPSRSNLTRSGQLLDSVQVTKVEQGRVRVGPAGDRYNDTPLGRKAANLTNQEVAKFVTEGGRAFNHLSRIELKRIADQVKRDLRALLKRRLTTK